MKVLISQEHPMKHKFLKVVTKTANLIFVFQSESIYNFLDMQIEWKRKINIYFGQHTC